MAAADVALPHRVPYHTRAPAAMRRQQPKKEDDQMDAEDDLTDAKDSSEFIKARVALAPCYLHSVSRHPLGACWQVCMAEPSSDARIARVHVHADQRHDTCGQCIRTTRPLCGASPAG